MSFKLDHELVPLLLENQKSVLYLPLKRSEKIKYTCFTVSKSYVIFGATSGGLYIFKRNPCTFWHLVPSKENAVNLVQISANENLIAFSSNKNVVCVVELTENSNGKLVMRTDELSDSEITALCWSDDNAKPTLFIGDGNGKVSFLTLSFLNKNILQFPATLLVALDSRVVQLCYQEDLLLVSTTTRCYLCDTIKEQYKQIGQQLRDGLYGTTFFKKQKKLFCARPGFRLWEVDAEGVVHSTHQFKKQLSVPSFPYISIFEDPRITNAGPMSDTTENTVQSSNFVKLYDFAQRYVVTFNSKAIYVLNIETVDVLFWNNGFGRIVDVQCIGNSIFVWNMDGNLFEILLLPIQKCLLTLYFRKLYALCAQLIEIFLEKLVSSEELMRDLLPLRDLEEHANEENDEVDSAGSISVFKEKLNSVAAADVELFSGIHVVNNKHLSRLLLDDTSLIGTMKYHAGENDGSYRKRSNSLPSELKKNAKSQSQDGISIHGYTNSNGTEPLLSSYYGDEFLMFDNLLIDTRGAAYGPSLITLASYDILREHFTELGTSFSEILNEGSKNLKKKLRIFESKITSPTSPNEKREIIVNDARNEMMASEIEEPQTLEPIVDVNNDLKKRKRLRKDAECPEVLALCDGCEIADTFELISGIVRHHIHLTQKYNFNSYRGFPFSIEEKWITSARKVFYKFFKREFLLEWFGRDHFSVFIEADFIEKYPKLLREVFTVEELKLDYSLSKVLVVFSELLNVNDVLDTIKSLRFPCYYESFCFVLKYFQNSDTLERSNHARNENAGWPLPVYLNTMLLMISVDQKDVFCEMGSKKNVDITLVGYMMLHLEHLDSVFEENIEHNAFSHQYRDILLTYVQKRCQQNADCLNEENVIRLIARVFLHRNERLETFCCASCWFLLPQRRTVKINFSAVGRALLTQFWCVFESRAAGATLEPPWTYESLVSLRRAVNGSVEYDSRLHVCYMNAESCEHVICREFKTRYFKEGNDECFLLVFNVMCRFCYQIPELWKYLVTLQENSEVKILYPEHFVQLKDTARLESYFPQMGLNDSRIILNWMALMAKGNCLNCGAEVPLRNQEASWNDVAVFILRRLGAKQTLKILAEYQELLKLDMSFYRSVILTSIPGIDVGLMESAISAISNHCTMNAASVDILEKLREALKQDKPTLEMNSTNSKVHHWGIPVVAEDSNQAICYCCSLPLFSKSLIQECNGGIMIFSCSHTYHTICLRNKDCTAICLVCDRFLR